MQIITDSNLKFNLAGAVVEINAATMARLWIADIQRKGAADPMAGAEWVPSDTLVKLINRNLRPPKVGEIWTEQGGRYAGHSLTDDGAPCLLIVAEPCCDFDMKWQAAMDWAKALRVGTFADFELPSRVDSLLLFQRLKSHFAECAHWTKEQHAADSDYAWCQYFGYGGQINYRKISKLRARAVRRLVI